MITLEQGIDIVGLLIDSVKDKYNHMDICIENLTNLILSQLTGSDEGSSEDNTQIAYFLAHVGIASYLQLFDIDVNLESLAKNNSNYDGKFGYTGLDNAVLACVEVLTNTSSNTSNINERMLSGLLVSLRDCSPEDYLKNYKISCDLEVIALLGQKTKEKLNPWVVNFIKKNDTYNKLYEDITDEVLGMYKYLFQDSFGLRPYIGVFTYDSPFLYGISPANTLCTIKSARTSFDNIGKKLNEFYNVTVSKKRQFDINEMLDSKGKPVYYPKKILEYAMGRYTTEELSESVYKPHSSANSWEAYEKDYVAPQIRDLLIEAIYRVLERNYSLSVYSQAPKSRPTFTSEEFNMLISVKEKDLIQHLSSDTISEEVKRGLLGIKKCICSGVAVVGYNNLGNKTNSVKLRIADTTESLSAKLTKHLFGGLTTNSKIVFEDGERISSGRLTTKNLPLPFDIYEYRHDFDAALTNAEPLFGYKAVELYQQRGVPLSWEKILLGEDIKGTPIFASLTSNDDLPMQGNFVHNIMAGSRSGKGVMTMNMLASAVAEEKPIFYIDRKPDMGVMFSRMAGETMFIINGGQALDKNDPQGLFADNGVAISGWENAYNSMPSYLKEIFPNKSYSGAYGDMIYYRAITFALGILMARVDLAGNADIYNSLGGNNGIVVVIDEFKNWQEQFEQKYFTCDGIFGNKHRLQKTNFAEYDKASDNITIKTAQLQTLDESKAAQIAKLQLEIDRANEQKVKAISELDVYCTTIMDKYAETKAHINEVTAAGFKDSECRKSDIFVIGQHINIDGYLSTSDSMYPKRDSGQFNVNAETKGKSLMRGILDKFFHDWFMGYNEDGTEEKKYIGANIAGSQANKWVLGRRYWAYIDGADTISLRSGERSDAIYLNPYLVLNNNMEDDPHNPKMVTSKEGKLKNDPDYSFVSQCRSRVNNAVPGAELWETVRLRHLEPGLAEQVTDTEKFYGHLVEGIGFAGLANMTKQANGKGNFNPSTDLALSGTIANYVANAMGYSDYKSLLFDLSPDGIFSTRDVVNALATGNASVYKSNIATRLPLFNKYGFLGENEEMSGSPSSFDGEEEIEDINSFEEVPDIGGFSEHSGSQPIPSGSPVNVVQSDSDGWYTEETESNDWQSYDTEQSSSIPFTREELAKALVEEIAPQFNGILKQKAIEMTVEVLRERGI